MKRRLAAFTLCVALYALSAVPASAASLATPVNVRDDSIVWERSTVVYCLSEDRYRLVPEVRSVTIMGSETLLDVLAEEVLKESQSDDLVSALTSRTQIYVVSVSQTGNVATVDLGGDVDLMQEYDIFCLKAALVNTLIESGGVEYVNVLFNGREVPTNGLPTGTMTRFDEDLQSAWVEHENEGVAALRSQSYSFRRNVTLYFPANDSDFLLAEVRELTFTRSNLATPVVEVLISGPASTATMRRCYPSATRIDGLPSLEEESNDTQYLDVSFTYEMGTALTGDENERRLQMAPLVVTLTTFLPETVAVRVRVNRRPIESMVSGGSTGERLLYRERYAGLVGRTVELFFPQEDGRLLRVTRAVSQTENTLRDVVEQLLLVPDEALPVFPDGFTADCFRGVAMVDDTAIVNLTQTGADRLSGLTVDQERTCIFSVVNTLTSYAGVNRVQFLVEGVKVDSLAGGLSLRSPLVRNPGIIQTSLS